MTKEEKIKEKIDAMMRSTWVYLTKEDVELFIGLPKFGGNVEIEDDEDDLIKTQCQFLRLFGSYLDEMKQGRCYDVRLIIKDTGPYDASSDADIRRAKIRHKLDIREADLKLKAAKIEADYD